MHKTVIALCLMIAAMPVYGDGVSSNALSDPSVVPIIRGPGQAPLSAPFVISEQQSGPGFCSNSQNPGTPPNAYGYEVKLACDHIFVGLGLLGGLYMLGAATATQ
jgi:hypothetical protein